MKKITALILICTTILFTLSGCKSSQKTTSSQITDKSKLTITASVFPVYDWVRAIVGDYPEVTVNLLLDNGVDLHSYQPTADDILKITQSDLFIYVGGESDKWLEDTLNQSTNKNLKTINLMEILGENVKEEKIVEGMEVCHNHQHNEAPEYDEHIWLSIKNAKICCEKIAEALKEIDADTYNAQFSNNANSYLAKLDSLDKAYTKAVQEANKDTLIFGDRFPFLYLLEDYGLNYYAAFIGCSAETEASFNTITFLSSKVDELGAKAVLTIDKSDKKIAETIIDNTKTKNQRVLELNSMQSTTSQDGEKGVTYLSVMENNLKVIEEALK